MHAQLNTPHRVLHRLELLSQIVFAAIEGAKRFVREVRQLVCGSSQRAELPRGELQRAAPALLGADQTAGVGLRHDEKLEAWIERGRKADKSAKCPAQKREVGRNLERFEVEHVLHLRQCLAWIDGSQLAE